MKSFLLSPFKHRLKVVSAVSLLLVLAWYALLIVTSIDGWKGAQEDARIWRSGQKEKCERLFRLAEDEVAAIDKGRCGYNGNLSGYSQCLDLDKKRRAELVQAITKSGCPIFDFSVYGGRGEIPLLIQRHDPEPLPIHALESRGLHLPILPAALFGLAAVLMLLSDFAKRVVNESNLGWRRLTVVASVVCAVVVAGLWLHDGEGERQTLAAAIVALCVSAASLVYGRAAFLWVADGFSSGNGESRRAVAAVPVPMREQVSAEAVSEPVQMDHEPPCEASVAVGEPKAPSVSIASFWPRLWARCVDLTLCWFVGSLAAVVLPDLRSMLPGMTGIMADLITGMAFICAAVFLYEWLFVCRLGATPGKMLFGISVSSVDGGLPSSDASKRRAWVFLKSGLYLCFYVPVLQILGAVMAWRRRDAAQPWDMAARTFTGQKPIGLARLISAALLAFCMFSLMVGVSKVAKEVTKEEVRRSVLN